MSVYKEPRVTNAFAGIHSTRNRIFCLSADRTECGSIIVRSDPVIAAPAILFPAESEVVMNCSAARGVDFPLACRGAHVRGLALSGGPGSSIGSTRFGCQRAEEKIIPSRLSANKVGVLTTGFEKNSQNPPHPVFHTFFAFECTKNALFSNSLQLGISQIAEGKKKSAQPVG
mgnify:CR=1 FL=1